LPLARCSKLAKSRSEAAPAHAMGLFDVHFR